MARNLYLKLDGGRWTWRRRVPAHLVAIFGRREIIRSLGSVPKAEARRRAREMTVLSDQLFEMINKTPDLSMTEVNSLVRDWFTRRLDAMDRAREHVGRSDFEQFEKYADSAQRLSAGAAELLRRGDTDVAIETVEQLLKDHGIDLPNDSPAFADICRGVLRAEAEARRINASRFAGDFTAQPRDPLVSQPPAGPGPTTSRANGSKPKFREIWRKYVTEKTEAGDWGADMTRENRVSSDLFDDICGNQRIDEYTRPTIAEYVEALRGLPKYRGKDRRLVGLSPRKQIEFAKQQPGIELIGQKSVKKHFSNISSFFGWCERKGYIEKNPAQGVFKYKRGVRRQDERAAWSPQQLKTLFTSPLYQGSHPYYRTRIGEHIIQDALYWLPLLAVFHPIRLEEGAQLRVIDVKEHRGITYMDVHGTPDEHDDTPARKVKSLAGWRKVPLHKTVIEVGFLDYVNARRHNGDKMLFDLEPKGTAQRYGYKVSKTFGDYRKALGLDGLTFHGFRHSAISALSEAEIYPDTINRLDGHEIVGERGRYVKDTSLEKLKDAIDKIEYPGITSHLIAGGEGRRSARKRR